MEQNPEVKRVVQRSLFFRLVQKPLDLPMEKQQELQTAIVDLLLTALTQNSMQESSQRIPTAELMCKIFFVQEFVHGRQGAKEQAATEGSSLGRKVTAWFACYS